MKQIRVLDILPALNVDNGVASYEMGYLRGMDHERFIVDVAVFTKIDSPYYEEVTKYGGKVYCLPPRNHIFSHIQECKKILKNTNYDIVHNNTLSKSMVLFYLAKKNRNKIRILHSHSSQLGDSIMKRIFNKIALNILMYSSNRLVACSESAAKCYFGNRDYYYLPNVISAEKFRFNPNTRNRIRNQYNADDKIIVSTVGRISSEKNPYFTIDVVREMTKIIPNMVFWWIGTGPLAESVKEYSVQAGIQDNIVFWGGRTDVPDLYQAIDAFILPSFFEGMPLSCIEAQAMGLPCFISDTITKDVAFTDLVCFLDLADGAERWANSIIEIIKQDRSNREHYNDLLVNSGFSDTAAGERIMDYYLSLINNE